MVWQDAAGYDYQVASRREHAIGPAGKQAAFRQVDEAIRGRVHGDRIACGGHALKRPGYFVATLVLANIADHRLTHDETFGLLLCVLPYD